MLRLTLLFGLLLVSVLGWVLISASSSMAAQPNNPITPGIFITNTPTITTTPISRSYLPAIFRNFVPPPTNTPTATLTPTNPPATNTPTATLSPTNPPATNTPTATLSPTNPP